MRPAPGLRAWPRHPLLVFVGIAFGWSWSLWLASRALGGTAGDALFGAAQLGPSLAGLAAAWLCGGRAELRALVSQALRWRVEPYWFAIALFGPILLWWIAFAYIAAVQPHSPVDPAGFAIFFPILAVQLAIGGGLGEELGWRGFLQSTLERRRGVVAASLCDRRDLGALERTGLPDSDRGRRRHRGRSCSPPDSASRTR